MANKKSDVKAKQAFIKQLEERGFQNAHITSSPSDIQAQKDGEDWYYEIKMTKRTDQYFGAATTTEWAQALKTPERFRFVVAKTDDAEQEFRFTEYTPDEFIQFSTIPPFKIFFNLPLVQTKKSKAKKQSQALKATKVNLAQLIQFYQEMKGQH